VGIAEDKFLIPAHQDNVAVASSMTVAQETRLLSFMPHMHLRGKDFRYTLNVPGKPPETLLSVPAYDFGWQSYYVLSKPIMLPKGARWIMTVGAIPYCVVPVNAEMSPV